MTPGRPRPLVGPLLVAVGTAHTALTPLLARTGFRAILRDGVLDAVDPPGPRRADATARRYAFWFATTGAAMVALGGVVTAAERGPDQVARTVPVALAGLGVWGVLTLPRSPFWVLLALAALAERRRRAGAAPGAG